MASRPRIIDYNDSSFSYLSSLSSSFDPSAELNKLLKCKICSRQFIDPIVLPCFRTVCAVHVDKAAILYDCHFCSKPHAIPYDGFRGNREMSRLIKIRNKSVDNQFLISCEQIQTAKTACKNLDLLVKKCESAASNSTNYIEDYFDKIEQEITVHKEELKQMIEKNHNQMMNDLTMAKMKCKHESQIKGLNFKNKIQSTKDKANKWSENIKSPEFCFDAYWKNMTNNEKIETTKLNSLLSNFKDDLLMFNEYKFSPNSYPNNLIGELYILNKEKTDDNRSEGTIRMVIDKFTDFMDRYEYRESTDFVVIKNVAWRIQTEIERTSSYDLGLGFYVRPDIDEIHRMEPISTEITLRLIQANPKLYLSPSLSLTDKFTQTYTCSSVGHGYESFLRLKDIMLPENGIYDAVDDCITLEAHVKVLDTACKSSTRLQSSRFIAERKSLTTF